MKVKEHTKVCDRVRIPQATTQFARYDTPTCFFHGQLQFLRFCYLCKKISDIS